MNPDEEPAMRMEDMILISVDDHIVEPPDMFDGHVPDKYKDQAPKSVRKEQPDGSVIDVWVYEAPETQTTGLNPAAAPPPEEYNFNPTAYTDCRPGTYDV